jgi:hypothetical protein
MGHAPHPVVIGEKSKRKARLLFDPEQRGKPEIGRSLLSDDP